MDGKAVVDPDREKIFVMYKYRCVKCGKPATEIHEKLPRSYGKRAMRIGNRVPLCHSCHMWAHEVSARNTSLALTQCQIKFLRYNHPRGSYFDYLIKNNSCN